MSSLYYFNPLDATLKFYRKDILAWKKLYNLVHPTTGLVDRTGKLQQPIQLSQYSRCCLPNLSTSSLTYSQCLVFRAQELFDLSTVLNKPLAIVWNGDLDSTCVVIAFLQSYSLTRLKEKIKILTTEEAIRENPVFYSNYILPNFEIISSHRLPWMFDGTVLLVTGEFNNHLFNIGNYVEINGSYNRNQVFNFINKQIDDAWITNILIDSVLESSQIAGLVLESNNDFFWWFSFCFKWQDTHFRIYSLAFPKLHDRITEEFDKTYLHHFYQSDKFQSWSINSPGIRQNRFKKPVRDIVESYDANVKCSNNPIKSSFQLAYQYRPLVQAITNEFKFVEEYNPHQFYNPENNFK